MKDERADDLRALGLPEDMIEEIAPAETPQHFEVWEENWPAVEVFLRCQTQWRSTMSGLLGLDYGAVAWLLKLYEVEDQRSTLEDLQVMEATAMAIINSRSS